MPHATPGPDLLRKAGMHDVPFDWADALRLDDLLTPEQTKDYMQQQYQLYRSLGESLNLIDAKL